MATESSPCAPPRPRMPPVHPLPSSMPLRRPCIAATTTTTPSSQPHTPWFPPPKKLASQKHLRADHCQSKLELRGRSDHGRQSAPSHLRPLPGLAKMRPNLINFSLNSCLSGSFGKGNGPVRLHTWQYSDIDTARYVFRSGRVVAVHSSWVRLTQRNWWCSFAAPVPVVSSSCDWESPAQKKSGVGGGPACRATDDHCHCCQQHRTAVHSGWRRWSLRP